MPANPQSRPLTKEQVRRNGPRGVDPRQIKGMPAFPMVPLHVAWTPDGSAGAASMAINESGLYYGTRISDDALLMFHPAPLPPVTLHRLRVVVEFLDLQDGDDHDEVLFALHFIFMKRNGGAHAAYTQPIDAMNARKDGGHIYSWDIPLVHLDPTLMFTSSLKVTLMSEDEDGQKKPVLIRGAWLEVNPLEVSP